VGSLMHNKLVTGIKFTKASYIFTSGSSRAAQREIFAAAKTWDWNVVCARAIFPHRIEASVVHLRKVL
jgi:hypothetical protein